MSKVIVKSLIMISLFSSCNPIDYKLNDHHIDSEVVLHIKKFESICSVTVNSSIILVDMPIYYFGECSNYGPNNKNNVIQIDRKFWTANDYDTQEQLIFHELGHCVLNKKHQNDLINLNGTVNAPKSIMYYLPFGFSDVYSKNKDYYYKELCGNI